MSDLILVFYVLYILVIVFQVVCMWIIYTRAGKEGWACLIPIYNIIVLCDITGRSRWWTLAYFVPFVGIVAAVVLYWSLAKTFGRSDGFAVGLVFLPIIFVPILAFTAAGESVSTSGTVLPQQGGTVAWTPASQAPQVIKCPFCGSPRFRVVEEGGARKCSECQSVLPSYIKGNK